MADPEIRVLIADDHAVVRRGLKLFLDLQEGIAVVGEARDGLEAVDCARRLLPDVVLMDLEMPGVDGIEATRRVREALPGAKVLVLTSFSDDDRIFPAIEAGAAGYLMKDVEPERLAQAIRAVHRGDLLLHPDVMRRLMSRLGGARTDPEGTVTILFTDIEHSTQILEALGDERTRPLFREHDRILRAVLREHAGVEVQHTGDGLMVAFASARRATACAVAMQRALAERNRAQPEQPISVRMGMNTGEAVPEAHGYFGEAVFVAARVMGAAAGGEILVSEVTKALAGPNGFRFVDRGEHALKGLSEPHRLYEVAWND